jgi:electron transport complex protein RnfB
MKRASVARIDEPRCIGCTRCIDACPVDAISGANGFMHAVIATGASGANFACPCPVDCIDMVPAPGPWTTVDGRAAGAARLRARPVLRAANRPRRRATGAR